MSIPLALVGFALVAAGICRDRPIFLLWAPGVALIIAAYAINEKRAYTARHRAQRRGEMIL